MPDGPVPDRTAPDRTAPDRPASAGAAPDGPAPDGPPSDGPPSDGTAAGAAPTPLGRTLRVLLGAPAFGTSVALTAVSTYVPVLLGVREGPLVTGLVVGGEGAAGLVVPLLVGVANDRWARTVAGRLRWVLLATPLCVAALLAIATDLGSVVIIAGAAAYFAGHFAYLTPYEALYPDLVPDDESGRSRSAANTWRFAGLGLALIGGGFLLDVAVALPFVLAAAILLTGTATLALALRARRGEVVSATGDGVRRTVSTLVPLLRDPRIAVLLGCTALWNAVLQGLKTFVVLFFTVGLGRSASFVSGVIFPLVALGLLAAVPAAGRLAERWGHEPVLVAASTVYGAGLLAAGLTHAPWLVAAVPLPAAAAGMVMTLNYSALMRVLPAEHHGAASGVFLLSRGLGCLVGPLLVGVAVTVTEPLFPATSGYDAMWFVIGPLALLTVPLLRAVRTRREDP